MGSNQFAVMPNRSANGHAMLAFDSHMRFYGSFAWMEAQISTPEFSIVGCTVSGLPVIIMGHNGYVAWSSTKNDPDLTDVYAFKIHSEHPDQYRGPDGWMPFEVKDQYFKFRSGNGTKEVKKTIRFTHIGPVLKIGNGIAYAGRVAGYDSSGLLEQMVMKTKAKTVQEYFQAFRIPGLCMFDMMAADTNGNIGYLVNAVLPVRDPALDWSRPVNGGDPRAEWKGTVPFDALPQVINPASGWLANCNDAPWYVTEGNVIEKEKLPFRLAFGGLGVRGRRISALLSRNDHITIDDMVNFSKDTEVFQARLWVPRLISVYEKYKASMALEGSNTEEAIDLLKAWDFRCDAESRAMALFYYWYANSNIHHIVNDSQITEDIVKKQLKNLGMAVAKVKYRYGRLDIQWGEILHFRHGEIEVPLSGGGGIFPVMKSGYGRLDRQFKIPVTIGSSYMMVVEMSVKPKAYSCFPIGINENPESGHFADMTYLYSEMVFKPVYYTWEELEPNVESDEILETRLE